MNYQTATDEEINLAVHRSRGLRVTAPIGSVDYCNNPADMMPVVFENRISLTFETYTNEWWAMTNDFSGPRFKHTNPLRAAAIVYLMLEDS